MKTTILQAAFAMFLAVAMLAGRNVYAQDLPEGYIAFGDRCSNRVKVDRFDGETATADC